MKKCLLLIAFAGIFTSGYCQDVKVNINNQEATTQEDCKYRINGICSTEDIGGVDVEIVAEKSDPGCQSDCKYHFYAVFTNYNESTVTVLYEIGSCDVLYGVYDPVEPDTKDGTTGSVVLKADGSKKIKLHSWGPRSDLAQKFYIKGMIVRKLK